MSMLVFLLVLLPTLAQAATYHVAKTGSAGVSCAQSQNWTPSTQTLAKVSVKAGITCLAAGDTLYIHTGTYFEGYNTQIGEGIFVSGTVVNRITLSSYPGEMAVIDSSSTLTPLAFGSASNPLISYWTIQNLDLSHGEGSAMYIYNGEYFTIQGNRLHDTKNGHGILSGLDDSVVQRNFIYNNGVTPDAATGCVLSGTVWPIQCHGIYTGGSRSHYINNVFYNNQAYGIQLAAYGPTTDNLVAYNTFANHPHAGGVVIWNNGAPADRQTIQNNIFYQMGGYNSGMGDIDCTNGSTGHVIQNNLNYQQVNGLFIGAGYGAGCSAYTSTNNVLNQNPGFVNAAGRDYKILAAGSPANAAGIAIAITTDLEGLTRGNPPTIGAYEFAGSPPPPQPDPVNLLAYWPMNEGTGTSAADASTGAAHPGVLNSASWGAGIIGAASFTATGTHSISVANTTGLSITTSCSMVAWINMTTVDTGGCSIIDNRGACSLYLSPEGFPEFWIYDGTQFRVARGPSSVLSGTSRHLVGTYDSGESGAGLRISVDNAQVAFTPTTALLNYSYPSGSLQIGRDGVNFPEFQCTGRIDEPRIYQGRLSDTARANLYNELIPQPGLSVTHMGWYAANAAPGTQVGSTDADLTSLITTPLGMRWAIHKADTGSLTEYFRPFCRTNTGAGYGSWLELGNSFGSLGVRYLADTAITQGQATSALLPLDGFTAVAGVLLESPIDTTSPYDAAQRITIAQGQHVEQEVRVEFGSPVVAGTLIQCEPYRENGTEFGPTNYANIKTLTVTAPSVGRSIAGPTWMGVTAQ